MTIKSVAASEHNQAGAIPEIPNNLKDTISTVLQFSTAFNAEAQSVLHFITLLRDLASSVNMFADDLCEDLPGVVSALGGSFARKHSPGELAFMIQNVSVDPQLYGGDGRYVSLHPNEAHWSEPGQTWATGKDGAGCQNLGVFKYLGTHTEDSDRAFFIPLG